LVLYSPNYIAMSKYILTLASIFLFQLAQSQNKYITVTGKVINAESKEPLSGASVFAENTTLGTATDLEGNYKLYLPEGGYVLVVSYTGFSSQSDRLMTASDGTAVMNFSLAVKPKDMETVAVVSTGEVKNGWEKYGELLKKEFIGKTANAKQCSIRNPEKVHFYFSKRKNRLKILADEPLLIDNYALGYTITYTLDSLIYEFGRETNFYSGSPYFEEMKDTTPDLSLTKLWKAARRASYEGSVLHFMRSVYQQRLLQEGFQIKFLVANGEKDTALELKNYDAALNRKFDDSTQVVTIKPNQPNVGVLYLNEKPESNYLTDNPDVPAEFQFSRIEFAKGITLHIEKNGFYFEQGDITINEYCSWERMSDMVPYDYLPEETAVPQVTPTAP